MTQLATVAPPSYDPGSFGEDSLYEMVNGQRLESMPMGAFEGAIASVILFSLGSFAIENGLGLAVSEVLFLLDAKKGLQRRPDLAFVSYARWPSDEIPSDNAWNVVPNLAIEIVSPTNLANEIELKIVEYFDAGVELVWVVHPRVGRVYVHQARDKCDVIERGRELTGGSVVPGFSLPVDRLFAAVKRPNLGPKKN